MLSKYLKIITFSALALAVLGIITLCGAIVIATVQANEKADRIIQETYDKSQAAAEDEKLIALATEIYHRFDRDDPKNSFMLRLRPYLTNRRLPDILRLQSGVIETHIETGLCDNAARMLAFLLQREGYDSVQWNMVSNHAGHSALLVTLRDGRQAMLDPFYGYATVDGANGALTHPHNVRDAMRKGQSFSKGFRALDEQSSPKFYQDFANTNMAAEGEDLRIEATLPALENGVPVMLGDINGKPKDVKRAAMKHGMTPYWQYTGHRYNREWVRVLNAPEAVTLVITLTQNAEDGVITATPKPVVKDKELIWHLDAGDAITFRDGQAKISLKRMNSYIDVDQIAIYPAD